MKSIIYGQNNIVIPWVEERLGEDFSFGATSIGLAKDGQLIAGVVYNHYTKASICMHVASDGSKQWLTREFLFRTFGYPFIQLECNRITALVGIDNFAAQKFDEQLGFVKEGLIRQGSTDGTDLILYGMLKSECRWINKK
jgi:RimJ/RimL family protein N-acetyltransferase